MRLVGQIHITMHGKPITRPPSGWEKLKQRFGAQVNLTTEEMENRLEATAIVDAVRRALGKLNVNNALSLVVDDTVVFQDADGKTDDLPDLVLALAEHASVFGREFRELRFAAEHEEAGLHLVVETRARTRHHKDEPAAIVSVGGRIRALEAQKGETAETYRARVEPLVGNAALFETARHAFQSFVARLEAGLRAALPEADVAEKKAEARLVKADARDLTRPEQAPASPMHPAYDPFQHYYPSPMTRVLDAMVMMSFMSMMMPPPVMMFSPAGAPLGDVGQASAAAGADNAVADASDAGGNEGGWDDGGGGDWGDGGDFSFD